MNEIQPTHRTAMTPATDETGVGTTDTSAGTRSPAEMAKQIAQGLGPVMGVLGPAQHDHVARWAARIVQRIGDGLLIEPPAMDEFALEACHLTPPGVSAVLHRAATDVVASVTGLTSTVQRASIAYMLGHDMFVVTLRMPRPFER